MIIRGWLLFDIRTVNIKKRILLFNSQPTSASAFGRWLDFVRFPIVWYVNKIMFKKPALFQNYYNFKPNDFIYPCTVQRLFSND